VNSFASASSDSGLHLFLEKVKLTAEVQQGFFRLFSLKIKPTSLYWGKASYSVPAY
jgi:hypothetical protein